MTLATICKAFGISWADAKTLTLNEVHALASHLKDTAEFVERQARSTPIVR